MSQILCLTFSLGDEIREMDVENDYDQCENILFVICHACYLYFIYYIFNNMSIKSINRT